jgi:hypothetical protein
MIEATLRESFEATTYALPTQPSVTTQQSESSEHRIGFAM